METAPLALIIDDEEIVRMVLKDMFREVGYRVAEAADGQEGLEVFARESPDIVLTDLMMPKMDGLTFVAHLKETSPLTPVIVISGAGDVNDVIEAIHAGAWDYVTKPLHKLECLEIVLQRVLERSRLIAENSAYQEHLEELVMQRTNELCDSEVRFRTLFESANDAIVVLRDGQIISCNCRSLELLACAEEELVGQTLLAFSPPRQPDGGDSGMLLQGRMAQALAGEPQSYEWRYQRHDGKTCEVEISLNRLNLQENLYLQAIMRDITERKKAADALLYNARINRELEIAQDIQKSLLPAHPPEVPGLQMASRWVPATHVGGDYYDFFAPRDGCVDLVIADVAGHSFGSALMMAEVRSVLRARVGPDYFPGRLLGAANELLHDDLSRAELQMSMFYGRLDLQHRIFYYANAGQSPPLMYRALDGTFEELDADGMLMGVQGSVSFEERSLRMEEGDILLLYTDGLTDAENADRAFFGVNRLRDVITSHRDHHPDAIMAAIFQQLAEFTGTEPITDDLSLVILKMVPSPSRHD